MLNFVIFFITPYFFVSFGFTSIPNKNTTALHFLNEYWVVVLKLVIQVIFSC